MFRPIFFRSTSTYICKRREIFQPVLTYNRKRSIVVKKPVRWIFIEIVQYVVIIDSIRKKNQPVRIIGPAVRIIGT